MISTWKKIFLFCILLSGIIGCYENVCGQQTKWIALESTNNLKNPQVCDSTSEKAGNVIYKRFCTPYHGYNGLGDWPVSGTLNPKPANHSSEEVQKQSDGILFWKISEGRGAMAAYKNPLTEQQRWSLVCNIRTLKKEIQNIFFCNKKLPDR